MDQKAGSTNLHVKSCETVMVAPSRPTPKVILPLSAIDNVLMFRNTIVPSLLVYNGSDSVSADPAKVIREAFSKLLVYYFPLAGRLRNNESGELQVDCTGEGGAVFVEARADNNLSVLGDFDDLHPSFQQLLFSQPLDTDTEDLHLLALQVTRFTCGGFVVGLSVHHGVCDGLGAGQMVKGLAEMARGEEKPSLEPIWNREVFEPEDPIRLQFHHLELKLNMEDNPCPPVVEDLVQTTILMNSETIKYMKKCIMEECKEKFSTFEVVGALAWRARVKSLKILHTNNVKFLFAVDMRRSLNPPLPNGYYGNAFGLACAMDNVQHLLNGSLSRVVKMIKNSKASLKEDNNLRSNNPKASASASASADDILILSDWRWLGFNEVDFGWGDAVNVSPMERMDKVLAMQNIFTLLQPAKNQVKGIKILMCMAASRVKSFKNEMEAMINEFVTATN